MNSDKTIVPLVDVDMFCCEGRWADCADKSATAHNLVIAAEGIEELSGVAYDSSNEDALKFYNSLAGLFGRTDDDILYYMDKFDKEDICNGDFEVTEVIDQNHVKARMLLIRIVAGYIVEKAYLPVGEKGIESLTPLETKKGYCDDEYKVQYYSLEEHEWKDLRVFDELEDAKNFAKTLEPIVG